MNALELFGLVSGAASVLGFIYAVYYAKQSKKQKLLAYDRSAPLPLATALSPEKAYKMQILFQRGEGPEQRLHGVHVFFLRFENFGREPIRKNDIAPANKLRVEIDGTKVLDIGLTSVSRSVCNIAISPAEEKGAFVTFDFLDFKDGAVLKILTEGQPEKVAFLGDVIGMPQGIKATDSLSRSPLLNFLGITLIILIFLSSIAGAAWVFHSVVGSWKDIWVLLLPFAALFIPGLIVAVVAATIWPGNFPSFADSLKVPTWYLWATHFRAGEGLVQADEITHFQLQELKNEPKL